MLAVILPQAEDKLLEALLFQKNKDFKVYIRKGEQINEDFETKLNIVNGTVSDVQEPILCILESGAVPDKNFVKRILHTTSKHPEFAVYLMNIAGGKNLPRSTKGAKLFRLAVQDNVNMPLSSFVFRTEQFRDNAKFLPGGGLNLLPTVLSCTRHTPIRKIWRQTLLWTTPPVPESGLKEERSIREKLDLYKWSEDFFGDENYPLSVSEQMELFAKEVAKLYPIRSAEEIKEMMKEFKCAQGPIRKIRAAQALKSALKEREKLQNSVQETVD